MEDEASWITTHAALTLNRLRLSLKQDERLTRGHQPRASDRGGHKVVHPHSVEKCAKGGEGAEDSVLVSPHFAD